MARSSVSVRAAQRHAENADQVEFAAFKTGSATPDSGLYDERIAGSQDDLAAEASSAHGAEQWDLVDRAFDDAVGHVHEELQRRADVLKDAYPFVLQSGQISYVERPLKVYEFFLSVSLSPSLSSGKYVCLPRTFERIATKLVASYFGPNARSMHMGFPRNDRLTFEQAGKRLHENAGEWVWNPEGDIDPRHIKDEGCDFVIWLEPSDRRKIGPLFVVGQCACGNDWYDKLDELKLDVMKKWFNPLSIVPPVRGFATPRHMVDDMLREGSRIAGLLFDRTRLVLIAHANNSDFFDDQTTMHMCKLIELVCSGDL